jgi:glycosyltransferase involved in cell wall biosynthesis
MKVAHVITRMIVGGAQENTLLCCKDLAGSYGDEVLLITGPALGPEGDLLEREGCEGVPVRMISSLRRPIHPWRDTTSYRELKKVLRAFAPDVVHTHSAKGGILGRLAAWSLRVPAILHTVHGAPFHDYQGRVSRDLFRWCETYAAKRCHLLVSVADAMTDQLVAAGVAPREKFITVYSGMEVEPFLNANATRAATRHELNIPADAVVVGKIARLFHLKGHEYVIRAAAAAVQQCPQLHFLFVGDGILRDALLQQIRQEGLEQHFHFTGLVDPVRIPALIGSMDILVHASLREGLARALPQALIAGKPVVSYEIDGAREVVLPGRTGFLLPPKSVEPMTEAIVQLATNSALRARLGEEGRRRFTDQFRHEHMTRELRRLYVQLLGDP